LKELGRHILVEFYDCDPKAIDDFAAVRGHMLEAARISGCTIVGEVFHRFSPQGVSGAVVVAESHLSIHTWPELGFCAMDLFTCGDQVDPWKGFHYLREAFKSKRHHTREIRRGVYENEEAPLFLENVMPQGNVVALS